VGALGFLSPKQLHHPTVDIGIEMLGRPRKLGSARPADLNFLVQRNSQPKVGNAVIVSRRIAIALAAAAATWCSACGASPVSEPSQALPSASIDEDRPLVETTTTLLTVAAPATAVADVEDVAPSSTSSSLPATPITTAVEQTVPVEVFPSVENKNIPNSPIGRVCWAFGEMIVTASSAAFEDGAKSAPATDLDRALKFLDAGSLTELDPDIQNFAADLAAVITQVKTVEGATEPMSRALSDALAEAGEKGLRGETEFLAAAVAADECDSVVAIVSLEPRPG